MHRYTRRAPPRYGMPGDSITLHNLHTNLDLTVMSKFEGTYACYPSKIEEIEATKDATAAVRVKIVA